MVTFFNTLFNAKLTALTALHISLTLVAESFKLFILWGLIRKGAINPANRVLGKWHNSTNRTVIKVRPPPKKEVKAVKNLPKTAEGAIAVDGPLFPGKGSTHWRHRNKVKNSLFKTKNAID